MAKNNKKIPTKWDLSPLFKDDNDPKMKLEEAKSIKISEQFVKKWESRTDWLEDPKTLKEALDEYNEWLANTGTNSKVCYYWHLRSSLDQNNQVIKAKSQLATDVAKRISNKIQFFELRLAKIGPETQKIFLKSEDLKPYHHYLERLFINAKHLLSEPEEKILTLTGQYASGNWYQMVTSLLSKYPLETLNEKGKREKLTMEQVLNLVNNRQKKIRDAAAEALNKHLEKYSDIAEHELNSILGYKKTTDELRGFDRPDRSRHVSEDIDTEVVETLIKSVQKRNDLSKKYYRLKAKILGQKKLTYHERNLPVGSYKRKFSYDEALKIIEKTFLELDADFGKIFRSFVENGQIDVYPKIGKDTGAFCTCQSFSLPTYILLNHTKEISDVSTIAHEAGHGINNELIRKNQLPIYFDTPTCTAEVASTFMEDFVMEKITKDLPEEERLSLVMQKLNDEVSTIIRQAALYALEIDLHAEYRQTGYLSKQEISKLFQKHMSAYMGPAVEQSPGSENWWVYWHHIRYIFYSYSYASGLLISKALQRMVRADKNKIDLVKEFLSAGTSDSPRNIFLKLGIDIADAKFWETGLAEIEANLKEAERLAKSLDKKRKRA